MTVGDNVAYGLMVRKVPKAGARPRGSPRRSRMVRLDGLRGPQAEPAVGRPAPARRARPRARQPAARAAARRAARRARPQAPRGDADRAQGDPAAGRDHLHLRDPRPGGGAHDERPPGGLQPAAGSSRSARRPRSTSGRRRASSPGSSARRTCSTGDVAEAIIGATGTFTVRPEKIHLAEPDAAVGADEIAAAGRIRDVVYLGPDTRYIVALDAGAELVVTQQNLATSSTEALAPQGQAVRLIWKRQHALPIADGV